MSRLLFRGFKTFWKTKSSIELIIVEYPRQNLYEIIAFDHVLRKHAPRLFVNKLSIQFIMLEDNGKHGKQSVLLDAEVATFLFNHIRLTEYLPESGFIKIGIRPIFNHYKRYTSDLALSVERPSNLPFYPSPFHEYNSTDTGGRFKPSVLEMGCVCHLQLSLRDKWRLPLILVRVSKSLPLRESDAKTWACFVHNKTQEELVKSIAFTLAERVPSENRHVLRSAAHSMLLPQLCPFPGSRSGNATPLTQSSASCRSSPVSSRAPSPSHNTVWAVSPSQSSAYSSDAAKGTQQRASAKEGLPPLTPNNLSRRSDNAGVITTEHTHQYGHRRVNSLSNMWPARLTGATLYLPVGPFLSSAFFSHSGTQY